MFFINVIPHAIFNAQLLVEKCISMSLFIKKFFINRINLVNDPVDVLHFNTTCVKL